MLRPASQQLDQPRLRALALKALPFALVLAVAASVVMIPFPLDVAVLASPLAALMFILFPVLLPIGLVISVPLQDAVPIPGEVPVTATRLMLAGSIALVPLILIRQQRIRWSRFILLLGILMATMAVSLWNAASLSSGYAELYRWLVAGVAFWLCIQFIRTRSRAIGALVVVSVLTLTQGVLGIGQALLGIGPASFQIGTDFSRAYGTFGMPNSYAAYLETATLPLLPVALWGISRAWNRLAIIRDARPAGYLASSTERRDVLTATLIALILSAGLVAGLAGIALSFSRGGWLGTIAALGVMVVLLGRRVVFGSTLLALILSLTLMLGASGAVLTVIGERFTQIIDQVQIGDVRGIPVTADNFATAERMSHWQTAIAMWDAHSWLGVGAGNFDERFPEFAVHPQFDESQGHAHNYYLHLLAETGAFGLIAYITMLGATFVIGVRAYRSVDPLARAIGIGAIGLSVALTVHNIFENLHVLNISIQMMLIWALALVAAGWSNKARLSGSTDSNEDILYDSRYEPGAQCPRSHNLSIQE